MNTFSIALLQLISYGLNQEKNLQKGLDYCITAGKMNCDLILFPEMWNTPQHSLRHDSNVQGTGYSLPVTGTGVKEYVKHAVTLESRFVLEYKEMAKKIKTAIAITFLEKIKDRLYNTVLIIDKKGNDILHYSKIHTCDFDREAILTPGSDFYVSRLPFKNGSVNIGAMICFDREFPESARILCIKGAELIIVPNACTMEQHRINQLETRAFENMTGIALCNYAAPQENGHSIAFDCMAFGPDEESRDTKVVEADENEGIYIAEFDMDRLREYRNREVWGDAYRKPRYYDMLAKNEPVKEFRRRNSRRDE
ncbi:MAG: carbon-nitrogen hydrolase family protein [Spirochaetales bacterium]|nr:carbon-nitrogen hydrolase family protein [Spirochaetales bacterium]